jgi:putative ABC transport system ATP-binding protein
MDAHTATQNTAFVPASFELLPMLTVEENVVFPLRLTGATADPAWIAAVLRVVEMDGRGQDRPADLSRGEQLRVALARALATRPETLVVDDLARTVDSITWRGAIRTLRRIADELELTVVLATGDAADAALAGHVGDAAA